MDSQPLHQDNTLGVINATPHQEHQTPTTTINLPRPPADHPIVHLTSAFHNAIQMNDINEIEDLNHLYRNTLKSNLDFSQYDRSDLIAIRMTALNIMDTHIATNTPLPTSPPNGRATNCHHSGPIASFKPPKIATDTWSGQSYDFYPWLASVLNGFTLTGCADKVKLTLTLQAIPMDKKGPLNNITDWDEFKTKLIDEYGSIDLFGREVNQMFDLLPFYESVQEIAEDLSPKIKKLQSDLIIIKQFHDEEDLHSVALTHQLNQNIMKRIPFEVKGDFTRNFMEFRKKRAANVRPPASFAFIAQFVNELARNYRSNPDLYDAIHTTPSVGVKPVRHGPPIVKNKPPNQPQNNSNIRPRRPCTLCSRKGFRNDHFPLNQHCAVAKLSSKTILQLISDHHVCPTCTHSHGPNFKCKLVFYSGASKVCPKGCKHKGIPVHRKACMHSDQTPPSTASKMSTNRSIPLVEKLPMGTSSLGIQYDTGSQLSLISQSALQSLPTSMYTRGASSKVRISSYAGEGKEILLTNIELNWYGHILKLSALEDDLNNSSGFTFPVPPKWRPITRTSTSHHSGQISILLGGDNHRVFPTELDRDAQGVALYQSKLTGNHMIYGPVPSNSITWREPSITSSINTVFIKSLVMQDLLDHPTTPDLPNQPEPSTKPESPTQLAPPIGTNPLTEPNPPAEPNPLIYSNPPTRTDPTNIPEFTTKSDPTIEPTLQPNYTSRPEQGNLNTGTNQESLRKRSGGEIGKDGTWKSRPGGDTR